MTDDPWADFRGPKKASEDPWASFRSGAGTTETAEEKTNKASSLENLTKGGIHSFISPVESIASLAEKSGADPAKVATVRDVTSGLRNMFGVDEANYAPAGNTTWDSSKSLGERLANAPRAVLEGAGPLLMAGGPIRAALLAAGTQAAPTIDRVRQADQTDPNADLTVGQKARVAGDLATQALLAGLGAKVTFGRAPVTGVGFKGAGQAAKNYVAAAATDAGLGAAGLTADKGFVEGELPSPSDLAVGSYAGGLGGAVGGARQLARESLTAANYRGTKNLNQDSLTHLGDTFADIQKNSPKGSDLDVLNAARARIKIDTANALSAPEFKQLISDDMLLNGANDIVPLVRSVRSKLDQGEKLSPADLSALSSKIGHTQEGEALIRGLQNHGALNDVVGNYYDKGAANTFLGRQLNPNSSGFNTGRLALSSLFRHALYGAKLKPLEMAAGAIEGAGNLAVKGIDKLTGAADPTQVFIDKFAGRDVSPNAAPSYDSPVLRQKAADKVAAVVEKQRKADEKVQQAAEKAKQKAKDAEIAGNQKRFNQTLDLLDRTEATDAKAQEATVKAQAAAQVKADAQALKAKAASTKEATANIRKVMGDLGGPETFLPRRIGRVSGVDMAEPASMPENPGYGSVSAVDPKDLAFNALLAKKFGIKDLSRITQFDNQNQLMDPSQVPLDDPHLAQIQHFIRKQLDARQEREYVAREVATEKSMAGLGLFPNRLATPDAPSFTRGDMTGAFPEPQLLRPEMPPAAEAAPQSPFLSLIDQKTSRSAKRSAKSPIEEAMAPPKSKASDRPMESAIRESSNDAEHQTRNVGRGQWELTATADKIRAKDREGNTDWEPFWRGVEGKVLTREDFTDSMKAVLNDRHHKHVESFLSQIVKGGSSKELGYKHFEDMLRRMRLSSKMEKTLREMYKKSKLSTEKHWQ